MIVRPKELRFHKVNATLYNKFSNKVTGSLRIEKVLKEVNKGNYVLRTELVDCEGRYSEPYIEWTMAYNLEGQYIGDENQAHFLCKKMGIYPELKTPNTNVCSVGYSRKDNKWYGWSHRAIMGFTIGDKVFEERWTGGLPAKILQHMNFRFRGSKTIRNMVDARQAASNFSDYVS